MKKSELRQLIKEELHANEGLGKTLATAALGAAMAFGSPSARADTTADTAPTTQISTSTEEDVFKTYSTILGYINQHSDQMMKDASDKMGFLSAKKELMKYCEQKRDGKPTDKLSNKALDLLKFVGDSLSKSTNTVHYLDVGRNIKH
jgi:hypothetical protein